MGRFWGVAVVVVVVLVRRGTSMVAVAGGRGGVQGFLFMLKDVDVGSHVLGYRGAPRKSFKLL